MCNADSTETIQALTVYTVVYLMLYSYKTTHCCKVFVSIDKSKNKVLVSYLYLFI